MNKIIEFAELDKKEQAAIERLSIDINSLILKFYMSLYSANDVLLAVELFAKNFRKIGEESEITEEIN